MGSYLSAQVLGLCVLHGAYILHTWIHMYIYDEHGESEFAILFEFNYMYIGYLVGRRVVGCTWLQKGESCPIGWMDIGSYLIPAIHQFLFAQSK